MHLADHGASATVRPGHQRLCHDALQAGRQLRADAESLILTYVSRAYEGDFPSYFDHALVSRLAAEFCVPLTEGSSRAADLFRLAEAELRTARLVDSQQATPQRVDDFTLIEARRS